MDIDKKVNLLEKKTRKSNFKIEEIQEDFDYIMMSNERPKNPKKVNRKLKKITKRLNK